MFDSAFASIATGFSSLAGAPFYAATARWQGVPTYDAGGSITLSGTPANLACQVQFDSATQAMRSDAGFRQDDVRMLVLSSGLARKIDTATEIIVPSGKWAGTWQVLSAQLDPAGVGWDCGGRRVA